ncbi:AI-2E family transporter [Nibrella viscosa]|uniref:AI-2E family transporter n=1 Tax=Nibrella viscosa TaxID=1084524 RepID=A0ABP8KMI6_9BACT
MKSVLRRLFSVESEPAPSPVAGTAPDLLAAEVPRNAEEKQPPASRLYVKRVTLAVGILVVTFLLLTFLWGSRSILFLSFGAILFALMLRAIADLLCRVLPGFPEKAAVGIALFLLVALFGIFIYKTAPSISAEAEKLAEEVPASLQDIEQRLERSGVGRYILKEFRENTPTPDLATGFGHITGLFGAVTNALVLLFGGLFLALSPTLYTKGVAKLFPLSRRPRVYEVLGCMGKQLRGWLLGQFISMLVVGVLVWAGLAFLDMPLALVLGVIAFLTDFIPFVGPIIGAIPGILLAFSQGPQMALYVTLVYVAVQQIESYLVVPLVQQQTVSLPPALIMIVALLGGALFGLPGIIIATPALVAIITFIEEVYVKDFLGDRPEESQPEQA